MMGSMDGDTLRRRREGLGLTQGELARLLGVYQATISAWENGVRGIRHPKMLALAFEAIEARRIGETEPREDAQQERP